MDPYRAVVGGIPGGRVLDVATGGGQFIGLLKEYLAGVTDIVGIDSSEKAVAAAAKSFADEADVRFACMDGAAMTFPDACFDVVAMSNSLHHVPDPHAVLREMLRVLKPGGWMVLGEMYRDDLSGAQHTHVALHHWFAAVDTAKGISHRETFVRDELIAFARDLGLADIRFGDDPHDDGNPKDPEIAKELNSRIDEYIAKAAGLPGESRFRDRGEEVRRMLGENGFRGATTLIITGRKV